MRKGGLRHGLLVFLVIFVFISMASFVSGFVRINEIMYNPSPSQGNDADLEWFEIFNNGTEAVNLSNWQVNGTDFDNLTLETGEFAVIARNLTDSEDNESFEAYYGNNNSVWDSDDASYIAVAGDFGTILNNGGAVINLSNGTYSHVVDYTPFVTLFPDTDNQGKTLIFYKGNFTESAIFNGTPGIINDQFAPDFSKWINPSVNNSLVGGLLNLTVNITDVSNVSSVIVHFNATNFSMSQNNELWHFLWNTSENPDGSYNITVNFNDTLGFSSNDSILHLIVDNTKPNITLPITSANSRNYANPGFNFNASVNVTDLNLLNITCALSSTTVSNFSNDANTYYCNLTSALAAATNSLKEQDFEITLTATDKAGNTNSTTVNFTTKYTTTASLTPVSITIPGLNRSDKIVEVNATLENIGSNSIYDAGVVIDSFSTTKLSATSFSYQSCSLSINNSQSCNVTFNITASGGLVPDTYYIFWSANWTNSNFSFNQLSQAISSSVTISGNPQMTAPLNDSSIIPHGQNSTFILHLNSTGNTDLNSVDISFAGGTIESAWVSTTPADFSSISAGTNETFNVTVVVPQYTNPGNYTGTVNVAASGVSTQPILLTVEVPTDNSWKLTPNQTTKYKKSSVAGIAGTFRINNTGNIGHNFTFTPSGNLFFLPVWNNSNENHAYVETGQSTDISIYHKQMNGNSNPTIGIFNVTLSIQSKNTSQTNITFISLVRDDTSPFVNITNPINNSFVKGDVDFNVSATDLNLSNIEFYINNELVFNDTNLTKIFNWSTNGSYPDEVYTLKSIAYDGAGNFNISNINVTVDNTDDNPILKASISNLTILEDNDSTILNLSLYFKTIDGDTLNYNFTQPDNITVHVTNTTQIANFTPAANFTGLNNITFTAIDSSSKTTSSNLITINVTNVNDAPTIPSLVGPESGTNVTSSSGKAVLVWNASIDVDNDVITYYLYISNDSSDIRFNATTTANAFQLNNLNNNFTYFWNVLASDGLLNSSNSTVFNFTIIRDNEPLINTWTWNNTINSSSTDTKPFVAENRTLNFTINASDPDNDPINFTWYVNNDEVSNVGNFSFNLTNNFTAAGSYTLKLVVQDNNSNSVSQQWETTVLNTNREPELDSIAGQSVDEDALLTFNITSNDPDNDTLTFTSNISAISFANDANNSMTTLTWIPTNSYVGSNQVKIIVNDSSRYASRLISITVSNTNDAPIITEFFPADNKTIAESIGTQAFNVTFEDIDIGDDATAYWFRNTSIIAANFSNVTVTSLLAGFYNITAIVNDTSGNVTMYQWDLMVTNNITSSGLTSSVLSLNASQRQNATNVAINESTFGGINFGNETLNLSGIVNLEDAFNISKGIVSVNTDVFLALRNKSAYVVMKGLNFTKVPLIYKAAGFKNTQNGAICHNETCTVVTYDVTNGILRFRAANFSTYFLQTNKTNAAPVITTNPVTTGTVNAKYSYDVDAVDPDGDTLVFSLISNPTGMSISSSSGVISWTPTVNQLGLNNVDINVSDTNLTTLQSFNITVGQGPKLIISDLDVKVDKKTDKNMQNNTKISKDAEPGSKVEFKLEISNLFTDDEDLEIENIDVEIIIEDIDDGDDLDEDADEFDVKAGKNKDVSVEFNIPLEVDEDTYDVFIIVEGDDENGTTHEILWDLDLDVEKNTHEIRILRAGFTPSTISCQRQLLINSEIINTGTKDEDEVTLEITSPVLGINSITNGIELDEGTDDNRFTKQVTESISEDVLPGTYPITFNAYYDNSLSETKTADLDIQECELTRTVRQTVKEEKPVVEVIRPVVTIEKPSSDAAKQSVKQTDEFNTLLAIMIVLFIGTAVFVVGAGFIVMRK